MSVVSPAVRIRSTAKPKRRSSNASIALIGSGSADLLGPYPEARQLCWDRTAAVGTHVRVPIICYHSCHAGNDYASDDHHALAADLRTIHRRGYRIVPLDWVGESLLGEREPIRNWL